MNCIFFCVFAQEKHLKQLYALVESLYIYGNLSPATQILIYTSINFMNIIKKSHLYTDQIIFEINDVYNTLDKSSKALLDIFRFDLINRYDRVLYLDTSVLVKSDINKIFDICTNDNLYTSMSKSTIQALLFARSAKVKKIFDSIGEQIQSSPDNYIYSLDPYFINMCVCECELVGCELIDQTIQFFPNNSGFGQNKVLCDMKDITIIDCINRTKEYIDQHLIPIISRCGEPLEGNIFMWHHTLTYTDAFLNKTKNISSLVLNKNIHNVMEIGFNSGFSALFMLISNPNINITCFDLGTHLYTLPCYQQLKSTFGSRINLIIGDSTRTLPNINKTFDLIHIDGGHGSDVASSDIINSYRLSKKRTVLIMDDYDFDNLHQLWNQYVNLFKLNKLNIDLYESPHHDIRYVLDR